MTLSFSSIPWFWQNMHMTHLVKVDLKAFCHDEFPNVQGNAANFINSFSTLSNLVHIALPDHIFYQDRNSQNFTLTALSRVTRLDASSTCMTTVHAEHLTCLTRLVHLDVAYHLIEMEVLPWDTLTVALSNLTYVDFNGSEYGFEGTYDSPYMSNLGALESAALSTNAGGLHFNSQTPHLTSISNFPILTRVTHLDIRGMRIDIHAFSQFSSLTNLRSLVLRSARCVSEEHSEIQCNHDTFEYIQCLPPLTSLDIGCFYDTDSFNSGTKLLPLSIAITKYCPTLETLSLGGYGRLTSYPPDPVTFTHCLQVFSDSTFATNLTELDISSHHTYGDVTHLLRLKYLLSLNIDTCSLPFQSWCALISHPSIRTFSASYCGVRPEWCSELTRMTNLHKLSLLTSPNDPPILACHMYPLMATLTHLHKLDIHFTPPYIKDVPTQEVELRRLLYCRN
jgi:hypothetical protein